MRVASKIQQPNYFSDNPYKLTQFAGWEPLNSTFLPRNIVYEDIYIYIYIYLYFFFHKRI